VQDESNVSHSVMFGMGAAAPRFRRGNGLPILMNPSRDAACVSICTVEGRH